MNFHRILFCIFAAAMLTMPIAAHAQGVYPRIDPVAISAAPLIEPGQKLKPSDIFRDCESCPDMVVVPPGIFVMGSKKHKSEKPPRVMRIRKDRKSVV